MAKKKIVTSNIQDNHTLGEYQRYFSHLLAKGKLKRFSLNEKDKLDPNRQYWKITDERGKTYYYELPKYIKPGSDKTAYSMNRVMHRRPARIALAIFAGAAVLSLTSAIITKNLKSNPVIPPEPVNPEGMFKVIYDFQQWHKENPDGDATEKFSVAELATIGIANALYDDSKFDPTTETYPRRKLLTVAEGGTLTINFGVTVSVHNAFIFDGSNSYEEAISYSTDFLGPTMGRRDYYLSDEGSVHSNAGEATGKTMVNWNNKYDRNYDTVEAYTNAAGKIPDNPFLYNINQDTVLADSTVEKKDGMYNISINLDPTTGVGGYPQRMKYLSDKKGGPFYYIKLNFVADDNLHFISSKVDEKYLVDELQILVTTGNLSTNFYYDNVPDIPAIDTPFDYSPYLPIR